LLEEELWVVLGMGVERNEHVVMEHVEGGVIVGVDA
jgi:hypothetical protein